MPLFSLVVLWSHGNGGGYGINGDKSLVLWILKNEGIRIILHAAGWSRPVELRRDGGDVDTQRERKRYFSLCECRQAWSNPETGVTTAVIHHPVRLRRPPLHRGELDYHVGCTSSQGRWLSGMWIPKPGRSLLACLRRGQANANERKAIQQRCWQRHWMATARWASLWWGRRLISPMLDGLLRQQLSFSRFKSLFTIFWVAEPGKPYG